MAGSILPPRSSRDCFRILGLADSASQAEVRRAFRKLALTLHPDRNPGTSARQHFQEVVEAYRYLSRREPAPPTAPLGEKHCSQEPPVPIVRVRHPSRVRWIFLLPAAVSLGLGLGGCAFFSSMKQLKVPSTWNEAVAESLAKGLTVSLLSGGSLILLSLYAYEHEHRSVMRKRRAELRSRRRR